MDRNSLSSTCEENVASAEGLVASNSHIDVEWANPSVTDDTSPVFNAKEGSSVFEDSGEAVGDEGGSGYAECANPDEQVGSSGVTRVPDGNSLSRTHEENVDNNRGLVVSSEQPSMHSDPDQATPRIISSITPDIRAPENEVADVVDSQVDVERENRSVPEDASPASNATEGTSKKRPRSNSALNTGTWTSKHLFASAEKSSGSKYKKRTKLSTRLLICAVFDEVFRQGSSVKLTVDSTAHPLEPPEKAERQALPWRSLPSCTAMSAFIITADSVATPRLSVTHGGAARQAGLNAVHGSYQG
ncbi:hypothetical protein DFH08DRAFT_817915 [Mycena albidolilacea]|uniref:Uncharacterized protein n=1 Tax=Mycena albidolilacea TaxID=1033008 RepID=A0AAD7EHB6_9AGAR|nr:hypothetical protein DFH08DRAFT_817915 [Mycena albidolilacea]